MWHGEFIIWAPRARVVRAGDLLRSEAAASLRYVFSRYYVPVLVRYPGTGTLVIPGYTGRQLQRLVELGFIDPDRIPEVLNGAGMSEALALNGLHLGPGGTAGGLLPAAKASGSALDKVKTLIRRSRADLDLLWEVQDEVDASITGDRTYVDRPARGAVADPTAGFDHVRRDPTDTDLVNEVLGALQSPIGYLFLDRTRIEPCGFRIGEHVYALSLAPGEEVTLEQKTFAKRQVTLEEQDEQEKQFDLELSSTLATELTDGFDRQRSRSETEGFTMSHTGQYSSPDFNWGKINGSHTVGYALNVTEADQETDRRSAKDSRTASSKVASRYRTLHKTAFKVSEERGFESTSRRVIRNPNRFTPITLHYFNVLQRLELLQEWYGVRLCWTPAVADPAANFFLQLEAGKKRIVDEAERALPPKPKPPADAKPPETLWSELTNATVYHPDGGQNAVYALDIPFRAGYEWDSDWRATRAIIKTDRAACSAYATGMPFVTGGIAGNQVLRVFVHVVAPPSLVRDIQIQAGANFTAKRVPAAADSPLATAQAQYAAALKEWEDGRTKALEKAQAAADAWEADMLAGLDPVAEVVNQFTRSNTFPQSARDSVWEIELWQKLFDWERAEQVSFPGWWADGPLRDPTRDASDFVNASWAKLYLPIRPGMERIALRWIFGQSLAPLNPAREKAFDILVEDLSEYRSERFGDPRSSARRQTATPARCCPTRASASGPGWN
jgi:hypothetical protein